MNAFHVLIAISYVIPTTRKGMPSLAPHLSSFVTTTKDQSWQIINLQICACCTHRAPPLQRYREQVLAPGGAADILSQEDPGRETLPHHLGGITPIKNDCNTCSTSQDLTARQVISLLLVLSHVCFSSFLIMVLIRKQI